MKRIFTAVLIFIALALTLSSCQVNWFGEKRETEWWVVAIIITTATVLALLLGKITLSNKTYVCPECKMLIRPKWWQAALAVHVGSDRVFKCPHCGRRGFCKVYKDK